MSSILENPTDDAKRDNEFLYHAIKNTQGIIQSVDIKLHVLLGFTAILLAGVIKVFYNLKFSGDASADLVYCATCAIVGLVSAYCTIRAIQTIEKPEDHVDRNATSATSFFRGTEGSISVSEIINKFPQNDERVCHELAEEFAKLIYIRQVKIKRQKSAIKIFFAWVIILLLPMFLKIAYLLATTLG